MHTRPPFVTPQQGSNSAGSPRLDLRCDTYTPVEGMWLACSTLLIPTLPLSAGSPAGVGAAKASECPSHLSRSFFDPSGVAAKHLKCRQVSQLENFCRLHEDISCSRIHEICNAYAFHPNHANKGNMLSTARQDCYDVLIPRFLLQSSLVQAR